MRSSVFPAVLLLWALGLCSRLDATTIYVGSAETYKTIQAGLNAATTGDTVIVRNGTYTGSGNRDVDFGGKAVTLRSQNGASVCIIDCQSLGRGFYFHSSEGTGSVVQGFTIKNGTATSGGGIYCNGASPTITANTITSNTASSAGGGIHCYNCSPVITSNTISDNDANGAGGAFGGGIYCYQQSPIIQGNTIRDNTATADGGGIYCWNAWATINNSNAIYGNSATDDGGGIHCYQNALHLTIAGNSIYSNTCGDDGAGICCYDDCSPTIDGNTITSNTADYDGGGIHCQENSSPDITNNTISSNVAQYSDGGGICCEGYSSPDITGNTIVQNSASDLGGGIYCYDNAGPLIQDNDICGNAVGDFGGGICCDGSSPAIWDNVICRNQATSASSHGGGIECASSYAGIRRNVICANSSVTHGTAIYCALGQPTIANNVIVGNPASSARAAIYCNLSSATIRNNTIGYNSSSGRGIYASGSSPTIADCILWANGDDLNGCAATYSCIQDGDAGTGNMSYDPRFVGGPSGTWTANSAIDSVSYQTTLTDTSASWTTDSLAGLLINPDTSQWRQYAIISNTATTITVWGTVIASSGGSYQVWDYHLKSLTGHWISSSWATDSEHSPCIDYGDPGADCSNEPTPNGSCVNMGAYGNTDQASKSLDPTLAAPVRNPRAGDWLDWWLTVSHP